MTVTQVHHAWRVAAIAYVSLWSTVDLSRPRLAELFMRRATFLHLDFELNYRSNQAIDPRILSLIQESDHEIWGANIIATVDHSSTVALLDIAKKSASTLRSLVVCIPDTSYDSVRSLHWLGFHIHHTPHDVINWFFPELRVLDLGWVNPRWSAPIFCAPQLRILRVGSLSGSGAPPSSLHHMLDTLGLTPELEELSLTMCLERLTPHAADGWRRTIGLPRLNALQLHDDLTVCSVLLDTIIRPSSCRTRVYCPYVLPHQTPRRHRLLANTMDSAPHVYGIVLSRESIQLFSVTPLDVGPPFRDVSFTYSSGTNWRDEARADLEHIGATLATTNISTIVLIPEAPEKAHWKGLTSPSRADTLHVDWSRLDLRLVSRGRWDDSNTQTRYHGLADALSRGFLPELRTLVMKGLDRLVAHPEPDNTIYSLDVLSNLRKVVDVLVKRIEHGSAFDKLLFVDGEGLPKDKVANWAARIPTVQFVDSADDVFSRLMEPWVKVSYLAV